MRYAKAAPLEQVFQSSIAELCRREGIAEGLYYAWSKEFLEAGKRRLAGDTARAATSGEVKDLRRQAQELKAVVAGQALALRLGRVLQPTKSLRRSLDHLIGTGEQRWRDFEAERLGGLEIDHQLKLRGLLHRQVSRLFAVRGSFQYGLADPHSIGLCAKFVAN